MSHTITVVGDIAWDVLLQPRGDLVWGADVLGDVELLPGGSAANVAFWAKRLGGVPRLVGKVGDDLMGTLMRAHLEREGLGECLISVPGGRTTRIGVYVRPDAEHAFVTDHRHALRLSADDLPLSMLDGTDAIFFNGYAVFMAGSATFLGPLLDEARRRGVLVAFDPSSASLIEHYGAERLLVDVGPIDILLANHAEAEVLRRGRPLEALMEGVGVVVVKQGPLGATAVCAPHRLMSPAATAEVVDTTGAGDAFDAAFLVEYLASHDLQRALDAGNVLGAGVAGALGAQSRR